MGIPHTDFKRIGLTPRVPVGGRLQGDSAGVRDDHGKDRLFQAARALNAVGWRAFPVQADDRPAVRGYHGATPYTDRELERMPWDGAVGLGIAELPGVISLDVDHKDGARHGYAHMQTLEEACGPLPASRWYSTRTGGFHVRYRLPRAAESLKVRDRLLLPDGTDAHIDTIRHSHRFHRVWNIHDWQLQ